MTGQQLDASGVAGEQGRRLLSSTRQSDVIRALSDAVTPQGVVAVCEFLDQPLDGVLARHPRLVALAAQVRDPGNAGSLIRVADAAGADAVVLSEGSVDPYNGKVVRASVGSLFHLPIVDGAPTKSTIDALRQAGLQVLAADGIRLGRP